MQFKSVIMFVFLGAAMAMPAKNNSKQAQRVAQKEKEGLNCQKDRDNVFVCSDESGANCIINSSGGGTCL